MGTPGQNGQPSYTQQVINDYVNNASGVRGPEKGIGDKFSHEQKSADYGIRKYKLVKDSKAGVDLFIGTLKENGSPCVIRRYDTNDSDAKNFMRDLEALQTKKKNLHENFIRYFGKVEVGAHTYYAVELCRYSVEELIRNEMTETLYAHVWKTLSREKIMHQTTLGLDYLHGLEGEFIHRNIHGRNVLVAEIASGSNAHYVVKLSDFRFGKPVQKDAQNSLTKSTSGWIAPEMNDPEAMLGPWTDVFILGCFFYYVLSGGNHPFGRNIDQPNRDRNITDGNYAPGCWNVVKLVTAKFTDLIKDMTNHCAEERTNLSRVLQYFQHDTGYFSLYPPNVDQSVKPGLCVIINQLEFPNIPTLLEPVVKNLCKNLIDSCSGQQMHVSNMDTTRLLSNTEAVVANYLSCPKLSSDVRQSFVAFLGSGCFPGYDSCLCQQLSDSSLIQTVKNVAKCLKPEVRHGSDKDAEALFDTFTGFGYDVRICNNLTAEQLRQTLKNLAKEKDSMGQSIFKRYASLVVCLLSHGSLGSVMGIDRQPVNVLELQYETFNSETCPDLNDKPKIFIIQACQGDIGQRMILRDSTNDDVARSNSSKHSPTLNSELNVVPATLEGDQPVVTKSTDKIKSQFRDVITLWSTIEGFVSTRSATNGSVFIQSLCRQLKDFGGRNERDLYEAHLDVTQEVTDHLQGITFSFQVNGRKVNRQYLINQTPLFKSTAYRKVAFKKKSKEIK